MKNRHNKKVGFKKGIIYVFVSNAINMVTNLLTTFLLPKFLSVESYANIKLFRLYTTYLGILHLGYADGMYLRSGGKTIENIDVEEMKREFSTFKTFQLVMTIFMILISLILNNQILLMCSFVILPVGVANYIQNFYAAIGEFKKYAVYTNINTVMVFIINLILLFIVRTDCYFVYIIAYVIVYFIYWFFIEYQINKIFVGPKYLLKFDKKYFKEDIKSGIFLMTGNFCNVIFTSIDRVFVERLIGLVDFAYYSFAASIENLMNIFVMPISTTMYNYFCHRKTSDQVVKIKRYALLFATIIIALIFPAKFVIEHWIPKYTESLNVLFLLIAAQYAAMLVKIVHVNLYKAWKKQKKYFKIMLSVILLSIVLNIIGYLLFRNTVAIAAATFITNLIWFIIGEIDLRDYRMKLKDYVFFILNIAVFLACGICFDAVLGFVCYMSFAVISVLIFERKTCADLLSKISKKLQQIFRRLKS